MIDQSKSLYTRLGGYDAITAVVENLLPRLGERRSVGAILAKPGFGWHAP